MSIFEKILDKPFEEVIGERFGRYSKYIIQDRALPDARDGLKPVQRRILYAMSTEGNTHDKSFRKSAKTVGTVIGNYHPHGDTSVYDAMVRMSQEWKVRNVLVDMHGNNGSTDGDPPAAMRYTEARLSKIASELLRDIEKDTVSFIPNFDDSDQEPTVLPARFPNLLVNGSTGISAGYATEIPPHHLGEVIDAVIMQLDQPDVSLEELMSVLKGPDFPTGGIIQGLEGIKQAYQTGKGRIVLRAKTSFEMLKGGREQIVITEIPYDVVKANLVRKIDELRMDRKVEGIAEVRDESDRDGLRIVVELRKEADGEGILNYLFKNTDLQITYNFNMVAISSKVPKLHSLKQLIKAYIDHQQEVVQRRTKYELNKAKERIHIVEGLIYALSILDKVIATIRASKDKADAKHHLMEQFAFTERQAEAIVTLQLYRLTNTDVTQLEKEATEIGRKIKYLDSILASEAKLNKVIKEELEEIKSMYQDERRSEIHENIAEITINLEVTVLAENVMVTVTRDGYVKRTSLRSYGASSPDEFGKKEEDQLLYLEEVNTTDTLLLFTQKGNYIFLPVHELPDIRWKEIGQHIANLIPLEKEEKIIVAHTVQDFSLQDRYLLFITKNGMVKKSMLTLYEAQRYSRPLIALRLKGDDELIQVCLMQGEQSILLLSHQSYLLLFGEHEVSLVGQIAMGVKGIDLKKDDHLVFAGVLADPLEGKLVVTPHRGLERKFKLKEVELASRARRGRKLLQEAKVDPLRIVEARIELDAKNNE